MYFVTKLILVFNQICYKLKQNTCILMLNHFQNFFTFLLTVQVFLLLISKVFVILVEC